MKIYILPTVVGSFLSACAALPSTPQKPCPPPSIAPVAVVTTPTATSTFVPAALPTEALKASDAGNVQKIANAYVQSITILQGEVKSLSIKLQGYQNQQKKPPQ